MLYVLEGCDGSGKTTTALWLSKLLDAEIIHCNTTTPNDEDFFKSIIGIAAKRNIIADRWSYGQFVYQDEMDRPLGGGWRSSALEGLYALEKEMLKVGAKVIYVQASPATIKERLAERNEILINGLSVEEVIARFDDIRKKSMLTWLDDWTD